MQSKVTVHDLKIGMYVLALDRPWIDTPFMLQGFLIENAEDIKLLQQYCEFIQVDWNNSTITPPGNVLAQQPPVATPTRHTPTSTNQLHSTFIRPSTTDNEGSASAKHAAAGKMSDEAIPVTPKIRTPSQLGREAERSAGRSNSAGATDDPDKEGFLSDITRKMKGLFTKQERAPQGEADVKQSRLAPEDSSGPYQRPDFIPENINVAKYVDISPIEQEITPAINAHKRANEAFTKIVRDIQSNKHLAIKETKAVAEEVVESMVRNPDAMMWVALMRKQDELVYGHGLQVAVYLVALGRHLGLPKDFLDRLCTLGLLLDIGKIKLPKELLLKNERLTPEEFELTKSHVQLGLNILKETPDIHPDVLQGITQHHERENGSGYPAGLSKDEIGLFGRMAAITDSFVALTNPRTYAETVPAYEALQTLNNFNTGLYQPAMVEQFIQAIGVFPVGSMIELSNGEIAVVVGHSKVRRLKPRVLIIGDANKKPAAKPTTLDLLYQPNNDSPIFIQRGLPTGAFGLDPREYYLA